MLVVNQFKPAKRVTNCDELISVVGERFYVSAKLFDDVKAQVEIMSQFLVCGEVYTPAEIVGYDYWRGLSGVERSQCVLILKDIAKEELDTLLEVTLKHDQGLGFVFTTLDDEFDFVAARSLEKGGRHE